MSEVNELNIFHIRHVRKANDCQHFGNLNGASLGLAVAEILQQSNESAVILCENSQAAQRLEEELCFFTPSLHPFLLSLPDWETLPYDNFSPHQDIISDRLRCLYQLSTGKRSIVIVPVSTAAHKLCPVSYIHSHSVQYCVGQSIDFETLRQQLAHAGYRAVTTVMQHGEFAIRGSIIDLYPMGYELPIRIDCFDNEIESLRTFDPDKQTTIEKIENIEFLPAHEFALDEKGIDTFRKNWRIAFSGNPLHNRIYQDVSQGIAPLGAEYYLPLFFDETATLFNYLAPNTLVFTVGKIEEHLEQFWQEINDRYEQYRHDIEKPILEASRLFLKTNELFYHLNQFQQIRTQHDAYTSSGAKLNFSTAPSPRITIDAKQTQPFHQLKAYLDTHSSYRMLISAESTGRREIIINLLQQAFLKPEIFANWQDFIHSNCRLGIVVAPLESGMSIPDAHLVLLTEAELFDQRVQQRRRRRKGSSEDSELIIKNLTELAMGSPVVHIEHGIGRYKGLETITIEGIETEFLTLEYADKTKLYVPVSSLHLISRYSGADVDNAPLNKLGSGQWEKARAKALEQARDVAAELLNIHARRQQRAGHRYNNPDEDYLLFANEFAFEETPDQEKAIKAVIDDLVQAKPMDRLVCGDVGFGKTEVAMRAAFMVAHQGKQVAVLVPTTLLATQHFSSFIDRFADFPIRIEMMSRFRTARQTQMIIQELKEGKIDIVIGTHKLLSEQVQFKSLGLVIIDEEHRFGVRQKEQLKALRAEVDILTLTATPIPRTLNFAFAGLRDLSIISTPPQKRLSIKTFVREYNAMLTREAILREIMRGGQVYYLHNEVDTIQKRAEELQKLVPEAKIGVGHGQLRERELEQVMSDFYHQRFNVLLCTTIIETGIDIPSANTIIIDRADKFGLAQLHQLRGRVGRSHHQAYAYLFTPHQKAITPDAEKRLEAIASTEDLGAGFSLATHDLEIRGAGDILGEGQSGNIHHVGFSLYLEMLERAVNALKSGKEPDLVNPMQTGTEIDLHMPALIPNQYLPDVHARLVFYKRIASARDNMELENLQVEMIDRFGLLPEPLKTLFKITELKLIAEPLGIKKIDANTEGGRIDFQAMAAVDPKIIIELIQHRSGAYRLEGPSRLRFRMELNAPDTRIDKVTQLIQRLKGTVSCKSA